MSDDLRVQFDQMIVAAKRYSLIQQHRDMVRRAQEASVNRCGDCFHWMHYGSCPRETRENGRRRGPSMLDHPCSKFEISQSSAEWKQQCVDDAKAYAVANNIEARQ